MTIEQRKISIINWITNLQDENILNKIDSIRQSSINNLPREIVKLLELSDSENIDESIEHTSSRDILNK